MKKNAVFFLVVLAVMCFARPAVATTPQCQAWLGAWTFTYADNGTNPDKGDQPVRFTSVCDFEEACMATFFNCQAFGTRLSDGKPIAIVDVSFDLENVYYYETNTLGQNDKNTKIPNSTRTNDSFVALTPNNRFLIVSGIADRDCVDADLDGYGAGCNAGPDCNDSNPAIHPGVADNTCNNIDENCSGAADEGYVPDATCGIGACLTNNTPSTCVNGIETLCVPGTPATEVCDGIDNNCDGSVDEGFGSIITYYQDADNDTYGNPAISQEGSDCTPIAGYVTDNTDCADDNASINPGATEVCNGKDDDCDAVIDNGFESQFQFFYRDVDNDGYVNSTTAITACAAPPGFFDNSTGFDCNDNNTAINPGASDANCNAVDENCSGVNDDGYVGIESTCGTGECASTGTTSCVDGVVQQNCTPAPGKTYYQDADNDSYGSQDNITVSCEAPEGYIDNITVPDCDDNNSAVNPGATEVCGNGIDDNCDGTIDDNCSTPCTLKFIPNQIFKFVKFFAPFGPYVLIADKTSGDDFGTFSDTGVFRSFKVRFTADGIHTINGMKISKRIIIGFYFVNPFKLAKGDSTVEVEFFGDNPYTLCADFTVK